MIRILGRNPSGELKAKVTKSANYRNGAFNNLSDTVMLAEDATFFKLAGDMLHARKDREPSKVIPSIKTNLNKFNDHEVNVTWFGHSSYHMYMEGKHLLIDPVFSGHASPFPFMVKAFDGTDIYGASDFDVVDILILTHDHYDHLDYQTLIKLKGKVKNICCSLGVSAHLQYWGFDSSLITELDWWESKSYENIMLTATPARHFSGRTFKRAQTFWSSFVLQTGKLNIFLGGDSGYDYHFKEIGEKFKKFELAILECGQYNEKWPMIHMTPEETVQAHIDLNANVLFPVHWGKFALAYHPWTEPVTRLITEAQKRIVTYTTPVIGEQIRIGSTYPAKAWWEVG